MTHRRTALIALIALLFVTFAPALSETTSSSVLDRKLPNGMRVIVIPDRLAPVVSVVTDYLAGADNETITGQAHALEHMMFRGSQTVSASQFSEVTAITGGSFNADTQNEITQFYFVMPAEYLDLALHLEASRASGLLLTQKLWNQERGAIMQEVSRDNSDADYRLYVKMLHQLLAGTPFADEGLGTEESFGKQIQAPQLQAYYKAWYHPNNAIMFIAGNVNPEATFKKVADLFGKIPAAPLPERKPVTPQPLQTATFTDKSDKGYLSLFVGYRFPGYQDPDYAAGQVLSDVLSSQRADLYALVASGKALSTDFEVQEYPELGMGFAVMAAPAQSKPEDDVALLKGVIDQYRQKGVPPDLVEAAKRREVAQAEFRANSISGLSMEWSQAVAEEHRTSPQADVDAIKSVTVDDVNRVMRKWLDNSTASVAYAVPANTGAVSSGGGGKAGENNTLIPSEHKPLPSWAQHVLQHLSVPQNTLSPVSTVLPNGLRLIVQTEHLTPTVVVHGYIRNNAGLQDPKGQEGIGELTESLLPYGTQTYDRLGFQAELDKIAASVSPGTDFTLSVLSQSFDRGVELLADDQLNPRFADTDFKVVKQQLYDEVLGNEKAPDHLSEVALSKGLYPPGDPERRFATPATVKSLTLEDVHNYFGHVFRPDMTTLVVVGDVTPEQAKTVVEKWFGNWKAVGPKPVVDPSPVPNNHPSSALVPDTGRIQDEVTLSETLKLKRSDADYAKLRVANTVLSGGFYASLLFHTLRELHGYVYNVDSSISAGRTRGTFCVEYGSAPANTEKAERATIDELQRLQRELLPPDRVLRAKALLLGEIPIRLQSFNGVANQLLAYASAGLPLDQNLIDARRFLQVTPQMLRDVMRRWIRPAGFVRIVQGPEPK
ncbi:MAG: M16 family metallopeptidase [Candidatus Xenobia bacterium]